MNPITIPCWCLVDAAGNVAPRRNAAWDEEAGGGRFAVFSSRSAAEREREKMGDSYTIVEAVATVEAVDCPVLVCGGA